jgi:hypothetical protein
MLTIKIKIGFDNKRIQKKKTGINTAVWLAAFFDSAVWLLDTILLLRLLDTIPFYPFGFVFMAGVFLMYLLYLMLKTRFLRRKYGGKRCGEEFGHMGTLLAAVSIVLVFGKIVLSL